MVLAGGKRIQSTFRCFSLCTTPASERSPSSRGGSWRPCQAVAWRRAVFLMPVPYFQMFQAAAVELLQVPFLWTSFPAASLSSNWPDFTKGGPPGV